MLDIIGASGHEQTVCRGEYFDNGAAFWRNELGTGHFEQLSVGVSEVDRVHEPPVDVARVPDATVVAALGDLGVGGMRAGKGNVLQVTDAFGVGSGIIYPRGAPEEGDKQRVTCVEAADGIVRDVDV